MLSLAYKHQGGPLTKYINVELSSFIIRPKRRKKDRRKKSKSTLRENTLRTTMVSCN